MNPLVDNMVADLRAWSSDLLEVGLGEAMTVHAGYGRAGSIATILFSVDMLINLVPNLLAELEMNEDTGQVRESYTRVPTRARLSRRPNDYRMTPSGVIPMRWMRTEPVFEYDFKSLAWLLHLLEVQSAQIAKTRNRTEKQVDEALRSRRGSSQWARSEAESLQGILKSLKIAEVHVRNAKEAVHRATEWRLHPSQSMPAPYPSSPAWQTLRRQAPRLLRPEALLPEHVRSLLGGTVQMADVPYLYQRWVGVKIVEALHRLGWAVEADPVGPIFLGGVLPFRNRGHGFDLWVEPRLSRTLRHPSRFRCARGEDITPDYVFVTPGPGGPDAFVLDATMATEESALLEKGRYLELMELSYFVTLAGCPVLRRPRISWSAAPLRSSHSKLHSDDGRMGSVPMHPESWSPAPLEAWLADVAKHALAWSLAKRVS